jgi:hypothetical protein
VQGSPPEGGLEDYMFCRRLSKEKRLKSAGKQRDDLYIKECAKFCTTITRCGTHVPRFDVALRDTT